MGRHEHRAEDQQRGETEAAVPIPQGCADYGKNSTARGRLAAVEDALIDTTGADGRTRLGRAHHDRGVPRRGGARSGSCHLVRGEAVAQPEPRRLPMRNTPRRS